MSQGLHLIFTRSHAPLSFAIRALTLSRWSHVGICNGFWVIEATSPRVRELPMDTFLEGVSAWELCKIPCIDPVEAIRAAQSQIGKPYDWSALFAFLSGRNWQDPDKWFCSELAAWSLARAGSPLKDQDQARVTPADLYRLSERLEHGSL